MTAIEPPSHPSTTPTLPKRPIGLALTALIVGIVAFFVGLVPVLGALVGVAAIVFGVLALRRQQSKGMAITGIVLGGIAAVTSVAVAVGVGAVVNGSAAGGPTTTVTQAPTQSADAEPMRSTAPAEETTVPQPTAPAAPDVPAEYASALTKADVYANTMNMSRAGVYQQLTSEYGEKFSPEAAQYAVDTVQADWAANALAKAKLYQEEMAMSPDAISQQLTSEYGEKFTAEEAAYAMAHLND